MFLSVVIPTYNRLESLQVTLNGLARQDYPGDRWEVMVVSDGSTDGTDAWLKQQKFPFALKAISQPNGGPARARNRGIAEAQGEVVVFLDDDVEPAQGFLAAHAAHHAADDSCVAIGPMVPDPSRREPVWIAWEHAMLEKQYQSWRTGVWQGVGPNHFYSGNASMRRAHLLAAGGFDEAFSRQEDVELAYRLERLCSVRFVFDPSAVGVHRPVRSFAGWLAVPYAYGKLDVVRAQRGDVSWDVVRHGYHSRSRVTRLLARTVLAVPALDAPARWFLRACAQAAYRLGRPTLAFQALSALYNVRYFLGVSREIGSHGELRRLVLNCPSVPS